MPERAFLTETWDDDWFQQLSKDQKLLFLYLWSNSHVNQAGLYHITLRTIAFEASLEPAEIPNLLNSLAPKVTWYPDSNLVWVKNFIKRQSKSSKFLAAAAKSLATIHHNGAIKELLDYNRKRYTLSIPYQYYIDKLSIPSGAGAASASSSDTVSGGGLGGSRGEGGSESELAKISQLYETDIGILTPIVAEELKDISTEYPPGWFEEALKEAVGLNHRNLKYIMAILSRWKTEGFKAPKKGVKDEQEKGKRVTGSRPPSDFSGKW